MKEEKLKRELMKNFDSSSMYFSSADNKEKKSNFSSTTAANGNAYTPVRFNRTVLASANQNLIVSIATCFVL